MYRRPGPCRLQRGDLPVGLGYAGLQRRLRRVVGVGVGADRGQRVLDCGAAVALTYVMRDALAGAGYVAGPDAKVIAETLVSALTDGYRFEGPGDVETLEPSSAAPQEMFCST
jgi:hypothetical protein